MKIVVGQDGSIADVRRVGLSSHHDGDEGAVRDLQEGGTEGIKAKALDEKRTNLLSATDTHHIQFDVPPLGTFAKKPRKKYR